MKTTYVRLADIGIHGNGHMLMIEKNNADIAEVARKWLEAVVALSDQATVALKE
jgi:hypothetical protein